MAEIEELFTRFVDDRRTGRVDPLSYVEQAPPADRQALAQMIDAFLAVDDGQPWDPASFSGSPAERFTDRFMLSLQGVSGTWPMLLPRLRERLGLRRAVLVERLAAEIECGGEEEKVAGYYHGMEHGTLPSEGVADLVVASLARLLSTTVEALRDAGRPLGGPPTAEPPVFARTPAPEWAERAGTVSVDGDVAGNRTRADVLFTEGEDGVRG